MWKPEYGARRRGVNAAMRVWRTKSPQTGNPYDWERQRRCHDAWAEGFLRALATTFNRQKRA